MGPPQRVEEHVRGTAEAVVRDVVWAMLTTKRIFVEDLKPNNQTKHVENAVIILVFSLEWQLFLLEMHPVFFPEP